ncbi:hypothetical protein [Arsenophonus sp. ENCA]|uniref:hypothetical protein n=1 Tax=Arsenophonus sp. ENCA TaxID=1987579 RepID=UPI0025C5FE3F|nr:hypothetical protein [Arsenophonus sp. ENCA]
MKYTYIINGFRRTYQGRPDVRFTCSRVSQSPKKKYKFKNKKKLGCSYFVRLSMH